jgi:hypothetical protein
VGLLREIRPSRLAKAVTLPTYIREVPGSNLARNARYSGLFFGDFFSFLKLIEVQELALNHDYFLPYCLPPVSAG